MKSCTNPFSKRDMAQYDRRGARRSRGSFVFARDRFRQERKMASRWYRVPFG
jgi:hypothetical protein